MRLTDILQADCVTVDLAANDKQHAIDSLVELLAERTGLEDAQSLKAAVWEREHARTTGIGHGIAIPHGKTAAVKKLTMALGKLARPVDFGAIDGRPVELIFLITSPLNQTGPHIQALATISKMLVDEQFRAAMKRAGSAEELYRLIAQRDAQGVAG